MVFNRLYSLLACIALSMTIGFMYAWSVFVLPLEQVYQSSRAEISLTYTFMMSFFSLGMFLGGMIIVRKGARLTAFLSAIFIVSGLLGSSYAASISELYFTYGFLLGLGLGIGNSVHYNVAIQCYPDKKGFISGITSMSTAVGAFVFGSIIATYLIINYGTSNTFIIFSILFGTIIGISIIFLQTPKDKKISEDKLEGTSFKNAILSKKFVCIWVWFLCMQTGGLMIAGHLVPYIEHIGFTLGIGAAAMGVFSIFSGIARPIGGFLFDKILYHNTMPITPLIFIVGLIILNIAPLYLGIVGTMLGIIIIAFAYGASIPQWAAIIMTVFGPRNFSPIFGFSSTASAVAAFIGPYIAGVLYTQTQSYSLAFLLAIIVCFGSFIAAKCLYFLHK